MEARGGREEQSWVFLQTRLKTWGVRTGGEHVIQDIKHSPFSSIKPSPLSVIPPPLLPPPPSTFLAIFRNCKTPSRFSVTPELIFLLELILLFL